MSHASHGRAGHWQCPTILFFVRIEMGVILCAPKQAQFRGASVAEAALRLCVGYAVVSSCALGLSRLGRRLFQPPREPQESVVGGLFRSVGPDANGVKSREEAQRLGHFTKEAKRAVYGRTALNSW